MASFPSFKFRFFGNVWFQKIFIPPTEGNGNSKRMGGKGGSFRGGGARFLWSMFYAFISK